MITLFEFQARQIERMAASLSHFVVTTDAARLDWYPATDARSRTRSIMEQVAECVAVNYYTAALLRGEAPVYVAPKDSTSPLIFTDSQDARAQLVDSGQVLAAAVRTLDDAALTRIYPHWRGPLPGEIIIEMPYRNMAYHAGQVNLIQMLAGDAEFHVPPTWLSC